MANFKTHLSVSTSLGIAYGGAAHILLDVPLSTSILAGGLCSVSGMLPDVDSDSGRPLRESLAFAAAVVPMMMVDRFVQLQMSPESMVMAGAAVYLCIRFGLGYCLKRYTVHRGMFHSLPAAMIMGQIAFLLASGDVSLRCFKAGAVVIGYLSHLLLDELYSFQWKRGRLRLKRSFGTALKMYSRNSSWANVSTYLKLALLTYVVLYEPGWMEDFRARRIEPPTQQAAQEPAEARTADLRRLFLR